MTTRLICVIRVISENDDESFRKNDDESFGKNDESFGKMTTSQTRLIQVIRKFAHD